MAMRGKASHLLQRAYEIDSSNAMVLNHMADVYFKRWSPVSLSSLGGASGGGTLSVRAPLKTMVLEPK